MQVLTDTWHGFYGYSGFKQADNAFVASILDTAGTLAGAITERHPGPDLAGLPLNAAIDGRRADHHVTFVKTYRPVAALPGYTQLSYAGVLSADQQEIEGDWQMTGGTGRFLMIRANRPLLARRQRATEWVHQLQSSRTA